MPMRPPNAATTARPTSDGTGNGSPRAIASTRAGIAPTAWVTATTASTGARRVPSPPPKSPDPQQTAEMRPRTTTATSGARSASGRLLERGVAVDRRRAVEDDDLVGGLVEAIGGGQVDDLEVVRHGPQELE